MTAASPLTWTDLLTRAIAQTYPVADTLIGMVADDELDWKPATGTNWMTTGQLLMHITSACGLCCQGFVTGDWGMPEGVSYEDIPAEEMLPQAEALPTVESVAEARRLLAADRELALRMIEEAGEERLATEMSRAPWASSDCGESSLGEHLYGMVLHLMAHKNQLFYYLKLQGKDVNTKHLWGM